MSWKCNQVLREVQWALLVGDTREKGTGSIQCVCACVCVRERERERSRVHRDGQDRFHNPRLEPVFKWRTE